jgi:flagellar biosynthesis anti-sigma factor FlgM
MTITNPDPPDVSRMNLEQTRGSNAVGAPAQNSTTLSSPLAGDSISLSIPSAAIQRALDSAQSERAARILELKHQIASNQYQVSAVAISHALIDAHLAGD